MKKTVSEIMLTLLLMSMLTLAFNVQQVKANGTIYIRADGSIDPPTAPIQRDGDLYTFTDNIYASIVVERDNIVVDGQDHFIEGIDQIGIGVDLKGRENVTIANLTITGFNEGIHLENSVGNTISRSNISYNFYGIYQVRSSYNTLMYNTIDFNGAGVWLWYIWAPKWEPAQDNSYNVLIGNKINHNQFYGVRLVSSSFNLLRGNVVTDSRCNFGVEGWDISHYFNEMEESNLVDGKPVYYWVNRHNDEVPSDAGYVALVNSTNIKVRNLVISNVLQGIVIAYANESIVENVTVEFCQEGILLEGSHNNVILNNDVSYSGYGVRLSERGASSNNIVIGNRFRSNGDGILLWGGTNNTFAENDIVDSWEFGISCMWAGGNQIYHNNFINNLQRFYSYAAGVNVWDDGYPSGGNYWSGYRDVDLYSGSYQNESGSDSIWDHPYVLDANNQDRYPLVNPWTPTPSPISDSEKQQQILAMVNKHRSPMPPELVLAIIRQEGGKGAFYVNGWNYNEFYRESDGPWAQPTNGDGIMQVSAVGNPAYHERSGSYTNDQDGYDHAINDGCGYLLKLYNSYGSYVQTVLHYNTGPNSLYIYLGKSWGDRNYLSHIAEHLSDFVPNIYGLQNPNLIYTLNKGQSILNEYLNNKGIKTGQSDPDYYRFYQDQLDADLRNIELRARAGEIKMRVSVFECPVNVTISDEYGRIISEVENQIPEASFEYFNETATKVFYLPLNLTYQVQLNATDYGNCTIGQITPTESIYETTFSQATFNLTSETVAEFGLLPYDANYTLKVDENGDGLIDYELVPEVETMTTEYDIGIIEMVPSKTIIGEGYNLPINITVTNYGAYTETFNVTLHINETSIELQTVTLASGNSTTITFIWNTAGFAKGNYTIWAYAWPAAGETDRADNTLIDGWVIVTIPGDVNGNHLADISDLVIMVNAIPSASGWPNWNPNADINNDGLCDVADLVKCIAHIPSSW